MSSSTRIFSATNYFCKGLFWIRSSCVVKNKLLNGNQILEIFNLWTPLNLKQILKIGIGSPFFWKWVIKLANLLKFSVGWTIFLKDYAKNHYYVSEWPSHIEHFYKQHVTLNLYCGFAKNRASDRFSNKFSFFIQYGPKLQ